MFRVVLSANATTTRGHRPPTGAGIRFAFTRSATEPYRRHFPHVVTPACTAHGAMNRVSPTEDLWRCLTCHLGGVWESRLPWQWATILSPLGVSVWTVKN